MPNVPDDGQSSGDTPSYLTAEDLTAHLSQLLPNLVNSAVSSHLKRAKGNDGDAIDQKIAAAFAKLQPKPEAGDKPDAKYAALEAQVQDLMKVNEAERGARQAAERKQREDRAFSDLKSLLTGQVRPEMLDIAASHLATAQKRIEFNEDGSALFRVRRALAPGMAEEDASLPLSDGVLHWIKSKEAAPFLPAPGAAPVSARGPQRSQSAHSQLPQYDKPATTDDEKIRRAMERANAAKARSNA